MSKAYLYCRVSTEQQQTDTQEHALLQRFSEAEITRETASGAKARPLLKALVARLRKGDTLAVAALDRLGRKLSDILLLVEDLERRGINLISLREGIDFGTPVGKMTMQIILAVAELERSLISQRTTATLQMMKAKGIKLGRPRNFLPEAEVHARELKAAGGWSNRGISRATGISLGTVNAMFK